jgi:hypothetical protein
MTCPFPGGKKDDKTLIATDDVPWSLVVCAQRAHVRMAATAAAACAERQGKARQAPRQNVQESPLSVLVRIHQHKQPPLFLYTSS